MYQILQTTTGVEPITLDQAKSFMRVSHTADDTFITDLIKRVREQAETFLSKSFVEKDITYYLLVGVNDTIKLPLPNHKEVTSVLLDGVESIDSVTIKGLTQFVITGQFVGKEVKITYNTTGVFDKGIESAMYKEILNQYQNRDTYNTQNNVAYSDTFRGLLSQYIGGGF